MQCRVEEGQTLMQSLMYDCVSMTQILQEQVRLGLVYDTPLPLTMFLIFDDQTNICTNSQHSSCVSLGSMEEAQRYI